MESRWYRDAFRHTRLKRSAELDLETTRRGGRYMSSVGGTLTGRGGRFIIIDDPLKPEESQSKAKRTAAKDWYDGTVFARLDDKSGDVIILVMQRLHVDDLVAHVLEKEAWVHLDLPAISELYQTIALSDGQVITREPGEVLHPERESLETLHRIEHTIGTYNFSAQYLQQPIPPEGSLIKWKWFRTYATPPGREFRDEIVQSWDTATSGSELADYSVCTTWHIHNGDYFLLDVFRDRLDFPDLRRAVIHEAQRYAADRVVIEDSGSGRALIQELRDQRPAGIPRPYAFKPQVDKTMRLAAQSAKIETGQVLIPEKAPWLEAFRAELMAFPYGAHDDQVDSLSQFLNWVSERNRRRVHIVPLKGF